MYYVLTLVLFLFPTISFAQSGGSLQLLLVGIGGFINVVLIPFILGIAFLIFLINAVRFFIIDGSNTEGHDNARNLALYGVGAFVLILSLWGMVNILADGIGLNEGPCVNGKAVQSDYLYGIDISAPCSSVRPTPRPVVQPDSTSPNGNLGQGISGAIPGGGTVDSGGSGIILSDADTPTVTSTQPQTSFTPDGNDFNYAPVATLASQARTNTALFMNTELRTLVSAQNLTSVQRALFSDIAAPQTGTLDKDRVVALLRLERLGKLPTGTAQTYFLAVEKYQSLAKTPIDARIQNFAGLVTESTRAVPLPITIVNAMTVTKNTIITTLGDFNFQNTPQVLNAELFTQSLSPNTRYTNFRQYYTDGPLHDQFLKDIKTEKMFKGDNSPLP